MPLLTTDRPFFFLTDLSYVGFVPVGVLLDIKGDKKHFTFGTRINSKISIFVDKKTGRRAIF